MIGYNTIIVLIGVTILGASAGMVGTFAVLRRRALTGDALSHAALPGLCIAFLLTHERRLPVLLLGAFLSGLLGVVVMTVLRRGTRLKEDACVGIVLSVFFGAGLVLSSIIKSSTIGGSKSGIDSFIFGKTSGMVAQDVQLIALSALACLLAVAVLYKELKLVCFDAGFARVQGWPAGVLDLLLMALLAVVVMIGLPAVGAVLMAALVILPGATARLWTDRLSVMLLLASLFGAAAGAAGAVVSALYERMPTGPLIILAGTSFFLISLVLSPRHGLLASRLARRRFRRELERRNLLRVLYDLAEPALPELRLIPAAEVVRHRTWSEKQARRLLRDAAGMGLLEWKGAGVVLTPAGLAQAEDAARSHRLWSLFLTEHADIATGLADLSEPSLEEVLPRELVEELARKLDRQGRQPVAGRA